MQIRQVGANGQISLGKKFAGQVVSIEQVDSGKWIVQSGNFIPESQKWLLRDGNMEKIERAVERASQLPFEDNFDEFLEKIGMQEEGYRQVK